MKHGVYVLLILLAIIPAATQNAPSQDCLVRAGNAGLLAQEYAGRINGLLRDTSANLQEISGRMAAGELTPDQADRLKLAATRAMMAHLETISAVYDARIPSTNPASTTSDFSNKDSHGRNAAAAPDSMPAARGVVMARSTVSVEDLRRENR